MSTKDKSGPLAGAKQGDWIVDESGYCFQLGEPNEMGGFRIVGSKNSQVFPNGALHHGGRRSTNAKLASSADLAAWYDRETKRKAEAKADADAWHADERIRDNAKELLEVVKGLHFLLIQFPEYIRGEWHQWHDRTEAVLKKVENQQ